MTKQSKKYLVVKGVGGIGNRFISLMKAINYAKSTNRIIYLDWCDGMFGPSGVNIFYKYFDLKNLNHVESSKDVLQVIENKGSTFPEELYTEDIQNPLLKNYYACTPWVAKFPIYKVGMGLLFRYKLGYLFGLQSFQRVGDKKGYFGAVINIFKKDNFPLGAALPKRLKQDIVVFADFRPLIGLSKLFHYIELKEVFLRSFSKFAEQNNFDKVIGVHVRFTDKKPKSKLEKLINKLNEDLLNKPDFKIFLCSDNNDVVADFKLEFGSKLIFFDKKMPDVAFGGIHKWAYTHFEEDEKEQMLYDCLADMWLLSMTNILYWQGNSSFSLISKVIKNDLETTKDWLKFK